MHASEQTEELLKPFQLKYNGGLIANFSVGPEAVWATNIKRSIAGILQLDLSKLQNQVAFHAIEVSTSWEIMDFSKVRFYFFFLCRTITMASVRSSTSLRPEPTRKSLSGSSTTQEHVLAIHIGPGQTFLGYNVPTMTRYYIKQIILITF